MRRVQQAASVAFLSLAGCGVDHRVESLHAEYAIDNGGFNATAFATNWNESRLMMINIYADELDEEGQGVVPESGVLSSQYLEVFEGSSIASVVCFTRGLESSDSNGWSRRDGNYWPESGHMVVSFDPEELTVDVVLEGVVLRGSRGGDPDELFPLDDIHWTFPLEQHTYECHDFG